jgi:hypothetical protein
MSRLDKQLEFMTRIPDVGGKPILNPKELERIRATYTGPKRYDAERAMMDALSFGTQLQEIHAKMNQQILVEPYGGGQGNILYDAQGNPYAQRNPKTGIYTHFPQPPQAGDVAALRRHANSILSAWGTTGEEFNTRVGDVPEHGETPGFAPQLTGGTPGQLDTSKFQSGPEIEKSKADITPDKYNAVRFHIGDRPLVVAKSDIDIVKKMYPRKGDPGYQEPVKVGKPQPTSGKRTQYPIGTRWKRAGVWWIMTDQGWKPEAGATKAAQGTVETGEPEEETDAE